MLERFALIHDDKLVTSRFAGRVQLEVGNLMLAGFLRQNTTNWDDDVVGIYDTQEERIVSVMTWRFLDWKQEVAVTLGFTCPEYRRQGHYRRLYNFLRETAKKEYPEARFISSGHHVKNEVSAFMFRALGRTPRTISYEDPL